MKWNRVGNLRVRKPGVAAQIVHRPTQRADRTWGLLSYSSMSFKNRREIHRTKQSSLLCRAPSTFAQPGPLADHPRKLNLRCASVQPLTSGRQHYPVSPGQRRSKSSGSTSGALSRTARNFSRLPGMLFVAGVPIPQSAPRRARRRPRQPIKVVTPRSRPPSGTVPQAR